MDRSVRNLRGLVIKKKKRLKEGGRKTMPKGSDTKEELLNST